MAVAAALVVAVAGAGIGAYSLFRMTPEKAMAQANGAMDEVETMGFTIEMITLQGNTSLAFTGEGEMRLPSDSRMTLTTTVSGQEMSFDTVTVGDRQYVKYEGVDTWGYLDMGAEAMEAGLSQSPEESLAFLESFSSIKEFENEEIEGIECYHFGLKISGDQLIESMEDLNAAQGNDAAEGANEGLMQEMYADANMYVEVWIGVDDKLLYREDISTELYGEYASTVDVTMIFTEYNQTVNIEAPESAIPFEELLNNLSQGYVG
ncbi:MAG: LppX_LprAFG lipoprotein [Actinomycetota bacterium]|nr:LppX_LprAFG lipoprotein [Actinomycetota bacterium]